MPKNPSIKKVLVIGSGPIIIGQAAEFDYAGTQACRALKEEGLEVVLINSNPATIMTDKHIADKVYIEPLTADFVKQIVRKERPDSVLPSLGGQTGLNLAMELADQGFWAQENVKLLGTNVSAIKMAEDRQEFKNTMLKIGEPCIASKVVTDVDDALEFAETIGYPVIVRPAYTLGGTGGGKAINRQELAEIAANGLRLSRVHQVLIEKDITGWKEIEYEVMRDAKGNVVTICNMENIDPVGVHTGDSIVVAPCQTLSDKEVQMLRTAALKIITALGIEGGCNVQFALHPTSFEYAVIEVNPRVSRSSALASKATGYPIAKVASKIAIGYGLDEIKNAVTHSTYACFEPVLDYCVVKIPKWPFDKFIHANRTLGTQMKATGEVMAISSTFESALMKAVRSLELRLYHLQLPKLIKCTDEEIHQKLHEVTDERIYVVAEALRRNISIDEIYNITKIDKFFLNKINNLIIWENKLKGLTLDQLDCDTLKRSKQYGFTDKLIAEFVNAKKEDITKLRKQYNINPAFKLVDTCAAEFDAKTPYYYSTYDTENESIPSKKKKVLVLGSGPIRIGQGIEFDYCSVHCVWALKEAGFETIIANSNPETVSTDFDTSDKLYFEPLTPEDIEAIVENEKPYAAMVQFGGQTAIKLTQTLVELGVPIMGTSAQSIDAAEDREKFDEILESCNIPRPKGLAVFSKAKAVAAANSLGYPVLVRPSYVLGGQGMQICYNESDVKEYMQIINTVKQEHPVLIDKYLMGRELEVDAICDGEDILIPGIMEHLERAGVHSGDSISVYPTQTIPAKIKQKIVDYTYKLSMALKVVGLVNIQFVYYDNELYVIEVNPRSSRTIPYISKVTNVPAVDLATACSIGKKLKDLGYGTGLYPESAYCAVKVPVFSFDKLRGVEVSLGPEMKSTGEVLGIDKHFGQALYKGLLASGIKAPNGGGVLLTVNNEDKEEIVPIAEELRKLGFILYATKGTSKKLNENGIPTITVDKIGEGPFDIFTLLGTGKISLLVNTPHRNRKNESDGLKIRRRCVELSISCLTCLDTVNALIYALKINKREPDLSIIDITQI
ncbi:MAG TPA: carbamoyl-phosphate synthase large subunit [Clostridia bacterium]